MSIVWSDDCLSCLAGLPHSMEKHLQALSTAQLELRQQMEDRRAANRDLFEDETETPLSVKLSKADVQTFISILQQSYHGY